eukprot:TRINITY_DN2448_c0_g2_i7.p1 TRINITY_DN2448_c0_g2~~TRINITY_DN2448_c0_g2_i7.p1  ORF type:complete len:128 (+),score=9.12 TRINITY_DN2448_c0_g2_i7:383-766(+)
MGRSGRGTAVTSAAAYVTRKMRAIANTEVYPTIIRFRGGMFVTKAAFKKIDRQQDAVAKMCISALCKTCTQFLLLMLKLLARIFTKIPPLVAKTRSTQKISEIQYLFIQYLFIEVVRITTSIWLIWL